MNITSKLSKSEFIKLTFLLLTKRLQVRVLLVIIIGLIISGLVGLTVYQKDQAGQLMWVTLLFCVVFFFTIYRNSSRMYASNPRLGSEINYTLTSSGFLMKGEGFSNQYAWSSIIKITHSSSFVLLWQNRQVAHVINKKQISESQITELKGIAENKGLANNL